MTVGCRQRHRSEGRARGGGARPTFDERDGLVLAGVPLRFVRSSASGHVFQRMDAAGIEVELSDTCLADAARQGACVHRPRHYPLGARTAPAGTARRGRGRRSMADFADGSEARGSDRFKDAAPDRLDVGRLPDGLPTCGPALPRHRAVAARDVDRARGALRIGVDPQVGSPMAGAGSVPYMPGRSVSPALGSRVPQGANRGHGSTVVITPARRRMPAESLTEGDVFLGVLALPMVTHLVEQPDPVRFLDQDGKGHWYTFDLLAEVVGGRRILIEIKPAALAKEYDLEGFLRFIAPQIGRDRADGVCLATEHQVPRAVMHDAKIIASARMCPSPADDERLLAAIPSGGGRLAELGAVTGLRGHAVRAAARLLGIGVLVKAAPGRIGPDLLVMRAGGDPA